MTEVVVSQMTRARSVEECAVQSLSSRSFWSLLSSRLEPPAGGGRGKFGAGLVLLAFAAVTVTVGGRAVAQPEAGPPPTIAFLATEGSFPDALAAGALAGMLGAPLLLTAAESLDAAAADALVAFGPELVVLSGGVAALSDQVAADVEALGFTVRRVAGAGRVQTAAELAEFAAELGLGRPLLTGGR